MHAHRFDRLRRLHPADWAPASRVSLALLTLASAAVGCSPSRPPSADAAASAAVPSAPATPPTAAPPSARQGVLWLLADVRGTPRTCGCAKELELGGFDRLTPWLAAAWEGRPGGGLVLHAGPLFFPEAASPTDRADGHRAKARLIADLMGRLTRRLAGLAPGRHDPVAAAGVSAVDLAAAGGDYSALARSAGLAVTTANVVDAAGAPAFAPHVLLPAGQGPSALRVGVFGLTAPAPGGLAGRVTTDPVAAARAQVEALRGEADLVVLVSDLGLRQTRRLLRKVRGVDLALVGGLGEHPVVSEEADRVGDAYVVSLHREGRWVGEVEARRVQPGPLAPWAPGPTDARAAAGGAARAGSWLRYRAVPLSWDLPQDPEIAAAMARFDASLKALARARAGATEPPAPKPGEAVYVGQGRCLECHEGAGPFARDNPHAKAWRTLEAGGKTFDPDCVRCHVTGYGRPGGALVGHTAGREAVQCEACHGPGSRHVAAAEAGEDGAARAAITARPGAEACGRCHSKHHSPGFAFGAYRAKLLVPGHGAP